jgi:hypothetical protein
MTQLEQRLVQALRDIATERGQCGVCGMLADQDSNYVACDDRGGRRCFWQPRDPVQVAKEALA